MYKKYFLTPGPTPIPEHVSLEMTLPIQHQRTSQCGDIFSKVTEGAKYLFQTKQDILIFAATATVGDIL